MSIFDVVVVLLAVLAAVGGYRLGFVTRVLSWGGLVVGLLLALLCLPLVLDQLGLDNQYAVLVIIVGAAFMGATLGQAVGFLVGNSLRPQAADRAGSGVDRVTGAVAGVVGLLVIVWLVLPVLLGMPGVVSERVSESWVAAQLEARLPAPPDAVNALESLVGEENFPEVFAGVEPPADLPPPPAGSGIAPEVAASVAASVVKVEGLACGRIQTGTAFVVADGLLLTNAHVVAGLVKANLTRDDGRRIEGQVVVFDAEHDLALLASPGIGRPPLPLGDADDGQVGGVFGHPLGEPLRIAPFEVSRTIRATGRDIYGEVLIEREVLELAASLAHGDSGSPVVVPDGTVVGVTFAVSQDRADVAYALTRGEVEEFLNRPIGEVTETGACVP